MREGTRGAQRERESKRKDRRVGPQSRRTDTNKPGSLTRTCSPQNDPVLTNGSRFG